MSPSLRYAAVVGLMCLLGTACGAAGPLPPEAAICSDVALEYDGVVVGSYRTTVVNVRRMQPGEVEGGPFADVPDGEDAVVCYVDAAIAKAPPGGEPFDRAIVAVVGGRAILVTAGYKRDLPVVRPE
jgi:hypothetical protein